MTSPVQNVHPATRLTLQREGTVLRLRRARVLQGHPRARLDPEEPAWGHALG